MWSWNSLPKQYWSRFACMRAPSLLRMSFFLTHGIPLFNCGLHVLVVKKTSSVKAHQIGLLFWIAMTDNISFRSGLGTTLLSLYVVEKSFKLAKITNFRCLSLSLHYQHNSVDWSHCYKLCNRPNKIKQRMISEKLRLNDKHRWNIIVLLNIIRVTHQKSFYNE